MKKIYIILIMLIALPISIYAQGNVGIGTSTPDASAVLDIVSTNKGLLVPRVSITDVSTFGLSGATNTAGMIVYNTNAATTGGLGIGYYYWNGTVWTKLSNGSVKVQNGINLNTTAPNASATDPYVELGGALIRNTTITQGNFNFIQDLTGTGTFDIQDAGASVVNIDASGNVTINNSSGTRTFKIVGDNDANLFNTTNNAANGDKVVIGAATADNSAKFQVDATNKGILIPRVTLAGTADATTITTPATSLLVYNTATAGGTSSTGVIPGYYYNSGTTAAPNWVRLATGKIAWETKGNFGTSAATDYIGTNDAQDFVIRTNVTSGTVATTNERIRVTSSGDVVINEQNNNNIFRVEGDNDANLIHTKNNVVGTSDYVGIGTSNPDNKLSVNNTATTASTANTYQFGIKLSDATNLTLGADATYGYMQSWASKPLIINSQGNNVGIKIPSTGTSVAQDFDINGRMAVRNGVIQTYSNTASPTAITGTSDLGLYSQISGNWMRFVTNNANIKFFQDQGGAGGTGTNALVNMEYDATNGPGVAIGANTTGASNPDCDPKAALDVQSTTKGMLTPRLTTAQRDAMGNNLAEGLLIYNTTNDCYEFWDTKATPAGGNGFWNSLCKWCQNVIIVSANQTGFNLNSYVGGAKAQQYCVYINSGVTLQANGNGGGSGANGNPGFDATSMPSGATITLYNYGNILAGGGNGGQGGQESDAVCSGDNGPQNGGAGGHAIQTSVSVPITVYNYGIIRAGGGGGSGGCFGCCSAGGGGGGGAGTPAGSGGAKRCWSCVSGFVCGCGRSGCSGVGGAGGATTAGTGGGSGNTGASTSCPGTCTSGGGCNGGAGGVNAVAGGSNGATGGAAGLALQGNNSGSSLNNISGTVTGATNP